MEFTANWTLISRFTNSIFFSKLVKIELKSNVSNPVLWDNIELNIFIMEKKYQSTNYSRIGGTNSKLIALTSALEITQLSNFWSPIMFFDSIIIGDQNKL